jgi:hypothetical protein
VDDHEATAHICQAVITLARRGWQFGTPPSSAIGGKV